MFQDVIFLKLAASTIGCFALNGCSFNNPNNPIIIYSCLDRHANETLTSGLKEAFPQYKILDHYISTGNCAARLQLEGLNSEADIVVDLEGGYARQITDSLMF